MLKPIKGTWLQFIYPNKPELESWNVACKSMTEQQWRIKINELSDIGMEYIVLLSTAFQDSAFFYTDIYQKAEIECKNPIQVLLEEADKLNMKVFLSAGHYGEWTKAYDNFINPEVTSRAFRAISQLYEQFGHYKSLYGWYLPDESWINKYFDQNYINYINKYSKEIKQYNKNYKILIAPYGTCNVVTDEQYISQLESIDCDIIAYQDEVGVQKATPEQTKEYFKKLKYAHDIAGKAELWADVELFDYEGKPYNSKLFPAKFERVKDQLSAVSPYVEKILAYTYQFLMSNPSYRILSDGKKAEELYTEYKNFFNL